MRFASLRRVRASEGPTRVPRLRGRGPELSTAPIAHGWDAFRVGSSAMLAQPMTSIETRKSWVVAFTALAVMSIAYGAPFVAVVALKPIAGELGSARSGPALAYSLAWLGAAVGGIGMGRIADRIGVRWTVAFGAVMIGVGLVVSAGNSTWRLWLGHGLFIGLLGNAGINAPLYIYVSRWFDRRRGTALALISSGQYVAGAIWPPIFERGIDLVGWRQTMIWFAAVEVVAVVPMAIVVLSAPPEMQLFDTASSGPRPGSRVLGLPANLALALLAIAAFMCCVPMAMPQGHLVALCSDLGIAPAHGAAMLSVLLSCAFVSRQFWGWISDRIGGLRTVLAGSLCQIVALIGFLVTQDESGLVRRGGVLRAGIQRHDPSLCAGDPRVVPRIGGGLARAEPAVVQRFGDGCRGLARRPSV